MKTYTRVIIQKNEPLTDDQITQALKVSDQTSWWLALVQLIDGLRLEYPVSAAQSAGANNALGMARDLGAHEALSQLLLELEKRRTGG
jgi:hypothetical protein